MAEQSSDLTNIHSPAIVRELRDRNEGRRRLINLLWAKRLEEALIVSEALLKEGVITQGDHDFVLYTIRLAERQNAKSKVYRISHKSA